MPMDIKRLFIVFLSYRYQRARPIIVDPGLYGSNRKDVFLAKEKRSLPSSFKLFAGIALNLFCLKVHF